LKLLNALVLAFFPFAAAAQTFDTSTIPSGCRDNHFLPMQGSMPVQIIQPTHDERGAAMLDPNPLASTGSEKGERAVQSTQENQSVKSSTTSEDELTVNGPIEQGSIPAQTGQAISEEGGAAGSEKADRIPAGAVQAADEPQTVKSSTSSYEP
jgi:hypothetical protein